MAAMSPEPGSIRMPDGELVPFVLYRSDRRIKSISLRIQDDGSISIRAPRQTPWKELTGVLAARATWIARGRSLAADSRSRSQPGELTSVPYLGEIVPLVAGLPEVHFPGAVPGIASDATLTPIERQRRLEAWYSAAARVELPPRVERWRAAVGANPSRVVISRQRAAWGTCAADGTIRLSRRLVMLRPALIDAVVVHELCHLLQHNHSPLFWREMDRVLPGHKALRAELREAHRGLPF